MNRFLDLFFVSSSREDAILKQGSRSIHAVLLSKKKLWGALWNLLIDIWVRISALLNSPWPLNILCLIISKASINNYIIMTIGWFPFIASSRASGRLFQSFCKISSEVVHLSVHVLLTASGKEQRDFRQEALMCSLLVPGNGALLSSLLI